MLGEKCSADQSRKFVSPKVIVPNENGFLLQNDCFQLDGTNNDPESQSFIQLKHCMEAVGLFPDTLTRLVTHPLGYFSRLVLEILECFCVMHKLKIT